MYFYGQRRFYSNMKCCIAITLGEERANLSAFHTFVRFALVWFCLYPLSPGAWEGLRFVIVALPGLFSYLFCVNDVIRVCSRTHDFCFFL